MELSVLLYHPSCSELNRIYGSVSFFSSQQPGEVGEGDWPKDTQPASMVEGGFELIPALK